MKDEKDMLRQAYVDGQLSVEEVISFEENLSKECKCKIEAERDFDRCIADNLKSEPGCPDALWASIKQSVEGDVQTNNGPGEVIHTPNSMWATIRVAGIAAALACVLTLLLSSYMNGNRSGGLAADDKLEINFPDSLDQYRKQVAFSYGGSFEEMQGVLKANGFNVKLKSPDEHQHHKIDFYGLSIVKKGGKNVAHLYFSCCDKPVSLVIIPDGAEGIVDHIAVTGLPMEQRTVSRPNKGYTYVGVGAHAPADVMRLISSETRF